MKLRKANNWLLTFCAFAAAGGFCPSAIAQVNPANPSFSATSDEGLYAYTFGTYRQNAPGTTNNFAVFNRLAPSGTTSPMSLVSISSLGYTSAMALQTGTITGIPGGASAPLQLVLNTNQPGSLSVSYILEFASDSLPASPHKFMAVNGYATILRHGDYDSDGDVDNTDYALWRSTFGTSNSATDGNKNGVVDNADYVIWRNNFTGPLGSGGGAGSGSVEVSAIPEPTTLLGAAVLALFGAQARLRGSRRRERIS